MAKQEFAHVLGFRNAGGKYCRRASYEGDKSFMDQFITGGTDFDLYHKSNIRSATFGIVVSLTLLWDNV